MSFLSKEPYGYMSFLSKGPYGYNGYNGNKFSIYNVRYFRYIRMTTIRYSMLIIIFRMTTTASQSVAEIAIGCGTGCGKSSEKLLAFDLHQA